MSPLKIGLDVMQSHTLPSGIHIATYRSVGIAGIPAQGRNRTLQMQTSSAHVVMLNAISLLILTTLEPGTS